MRMYDLILKKRNGHALSKEEIAFFVNGYTRGEIPDYQASALLMAICLRGMQPHETAELTACMAHSGDMVDLSDIPEIKVDKHSTGGVGDKTTLICAPIAAACGVSVAKMSGRGLGHTGGTYDKLESIPGLSMQISRERFLQIVREIGLSVIGQTGNIAPADKKLYALRDVTATVDSLPLIASSIMSKKLAAGADAIVLDVKTGSGAFMKTLDDAIALAREMVSIGVHNGKRMMALITDMDVPLGYTIGNSLEVIEAVQTLRGQGPVDLTQVSLRLAAGMLQLAGKGDWDTCYRMARASLSDGSAYGAFRAMVQAQGGDVSVLDNTEAFEKAPICHTVKAKRAGWVRNMQTQACGMASMLLGAGRRHKEDEIDPHAGIVLLKKRGDPVAAGEAIAVLHTSDSGAVQQAQQMLLDAIEIGALPPAPVKRILARVEKDIVKIF